MPCYHHLSDTLSVLDGEGLSGEIDQGDHEFATVVRVDGTWTVGEGDAVLRGQATTRADLSFIAKGELHEETRGDEYSIEGLKDDGLREVGSYIHACRARSSVAWGRMVRLID